MWVALGAGVIALMMIGLQVLGQTRHAFGDHSSYWAPWYFKFWFLVVEFCFGVVAIALGLFAALRKPGPLATIVVALAAAVFFQGALDMYYRVVVNHFGYGLSLSF